MADLAAIRRAVVAWLATLVAGVVALVTAAVLPLWVKVSIDVGGRAEDVQEAYVGLWQTCRLDDESVYNCSTTLDDSSMAGQRRHESATNSVSWVS